MLVPMISSELKFLTIRHSTRGTIVQPARAKFNGQTLPAELIFIRTYNDLCPSRSPANSLTLIAPRARKNTGVANKKAPRRAALSLPAAGPHLFRRSFAVSDLLCAEELEQ